MKIKTLWFAIFILLAGINTKAQTSRKIYKINNESAVISPEAKAIKIFKRSYPDVTNAKWRIENGYYFVSFIKNGVKNKIVYANDGHLDYSLKMFNGNNLPNAVRTAVKSIYFDYKIIDAQELNVKKQTIYLVKINNADNWRTIRVCNDNFEEIENYSSVISPCR